MKEWHEMGKGIRRYLNPGSFPVAIKFLKDKKGYSRGDSNSHERS